MSKKAKIHEPYIALKLALAGKGITYKAVAALLGLSETTVQLKINGYSDFYISEQKKICEEFGIDPTVFFAENVA